MTTTARVLDDPDVENGIRYPSSDGKPMAETYLHVLTIRLLLDALDDLFESRDDVFVAGNMNWYWEKSNPKKRRAPDAMVVFGVEKLDRRSFRSWNEGGAVPSVCFEIASQKTWKANLGAIKDDYEVAGVKEYFIFDALRDCLPHPLMGYRRRGKTFHQLKPDANGVLTSQVLGLVLVPEERMLRLVHVESGERVLTRSEQIKLTRAGMSASEALAKKLREELKVNGKPLNGHA